MDFNKSNRYSVSPDEDFEPDSNEEVLKNYLGIKSKAIIEEIEQRELGRYALGLVHVELILIHPFREGNGRTARLLADLMAAQANKPPLNYAYIDQIENPEGFTEYVKAIHASVSLNYNPIQKIFITLLEGST